MRAFFRAPTFLSSLIVFMGATRVSRAAWGFALSAASARSAGSSGALGDSLNSATTKKAVILFSFIMASTWAASASSPSR